MNRTDGSIRRRIEWTPGRLLVVALGTLTAGLHAYIGAVTDTTYFLVLAAGLLAGVLVFFTVYWNPALYLVGMAYVTTLLVVWFLDGMRLFVLGIADALVQIALVATFLYLFAREHDERVAGADR